MTTYSQNITKTYGKHLALDRFSLRMTPGIYALLGPNGAGKSTLLHILTDNLKASGGTVVYTDDSGVSEPVASMGARFREKLGFMPQAPSMYRNFSAERFLWYVASLKGMRRAQAARQIPEVLHTVDLSDAAKWRIGTFSGGMKQRLSLAQAILGDPEILILDEPTAWLDPNQRIAVRNYLSQIALNKIILIATHIVADVEHIAKEVIVMDKGRIVTKGSPTALAQSVGGRVWQASACAEDVEAVQARHRVTAISPQPSDPSRFTLRILSEEKPTSDARMVAPTLEDYYLDTFGEQAGFQSSIYMEEI